MLILLETLIFALCLSVHLQMVGGTKVLVDTHGIAESCPELRGELGPTIRNDALRYVSTL